MNPFAPSDPWWQSCRCSEESNSTSENCADTICVTSPKAEFFGRHRGLFHGHSSHLKTDVARSTLWKMELKKEILMLWKQVHSIGL
jgi:hypothetical protein